MEKFEYLGDGVYAAWNGVDVRLMANDHQNPTDVIWLTPEVLKELNRFYNKHMSEGMNETH